MSTRARRGSRCTSASTGSIPRHYKGWDGALQGCENDANDLAAIAKRRRVRDVDVVERRRHRRRGHRRDRCRGRTARGRRLLPPHLLGSRSQLPTPCEQADAACRDGSGRRTDQRDETWVLFDRQLLDDELYRCWRRFEPGVRVLVLSDSCHSGSAIREVPGEPVDERGRATMPKAQALAVYEANRRCTTRSARVPRRTSDRDRARRARAAASPAVRTSRPRPTAPATGCSPDVARRVGRRRVQGRLQEVLQGDREPGCPRGRNRTG